MKIIHLGVWFHQWSGTLMYSQQNLPLSASPQYLSLEAPYRYQFQYFCQVIKLSPPPQSWLSCWLSLVHHGCLWSSRDWECKGSACWDVYVPAQGCLQSYTALFDSLQHRLACVYLSQFPTGFVCKIRAAQGIQEGDSTFLQPEARLSVLLLGDLRHHNVIQKWFLA